MTLLLLLDRGRSAPLLIFTVAVMAIGWYGGLWPGLVATLLGSLAGAYALIDNTGLVPGQSNRWAHVALFLAIGSLISLMCERLHRAAREVTAGETALLRQSEVYRNAIIESALDSIIAMDQHGRIVEFNPAAERTFGYRRKDVIGRTVAETVIPPRLREAHRRGLATFVETGAGPVMGKRVEMPAMHADGSEFPVELAITVTRQGTDAIVFIAYLRDITERRQAECEREQLLASERAARSEAERAARLKDEFLAVVSHELRTPLQAILGWATVLRDPRIDAQALAQGMETLERNARAQAKIIDDLLDMNRIIAGKVRLDVQHVDLPALVEAALETVRPAAATKSIRLQQALEPLARPIRGDPGLLQQVVCNILSNAIKFTPAGGAVRVELERVDSQIEIRVKDTGQGIDPAFLPHVFQRFRQADASITREQRGLGLGLAIVQHLVGLHGGAVLVESPGIEQGSTFTVVLPLDAVLEPRAGSPADRAASAPRAPLTLQGIRVLVVDDEADGRELIAHVLQALEAEVYTVGCAKEALDMLERHRPHVLVSDIGMPGHDGYELIRNVRALDAESGGGTPAVALTALARPEDRQQALASGYQMHVAKPVEPSELAHVIASLARTEQDSGAPTVHCSSCGTKG